MKKVPFTNHTDTPKHIGPVTVMPNQTRMVEAQYLVIKAREEMIETTAAAWNLKEFVKQSQAKEIEQLPELTDEQFNEVLAYYQEHKAPQKLEPALEAEKVAREEARKADEYMATLEAMTDEELKEELLAVSEDEGKLALVQDQLSKRKE